MMRRAIRGTSTNPLSLTGSLSSAGLEVQLKDPGWMELRKLDDLVPAFVEAVPRDPFDGQPMRYSAERRIVWSVGKNLKDDNGSKLDSSGNTMDDAYRKKMLDYVIDIPPLPK